ncbi:hypothetical protein BBO99_00009292 [Phytophthora kernoviae]|uniref:Essential protein Yae1 N-terminal domain-containing protein n=2 Tax=Phytophthora kernoviae TaxID=325452 RepID=A0A3R7IHM5_9STRA|nr:hypothetical protein G195_010272 [Phytophthora kernoviae 00238/432]KAG2509581.1 hypothetical protein JM16_008673 [Phytophthora kernoviae]KAG2510739.1 hypothetical protein JM18_008851 [Phytophthora kernoviae]RLN14313.1 hypothetical protein BBI17_009038 [Phytophthora kernoviae]RLN73677.1 hypothetical protein BBO99_00009292 [Phytophthora kernoviae]
MTRPVPTNSLPPAAGAASDSDDGFGDFLSEEEEEETLLAQETVALERRMKTAGIRDGLEIGKEDTLQEGFDQGFALGAKRSFQFALLRGTLATAVACGLFQNQEDILSQVQSCMKQLRTLEMDTHISEGEQMDTSSQETDKTVQQAQKLLERIGMSRPGPPAN